MPLDAAASRRATPHFKLIYVEKPFYMWADAGAVSWKVWGKTIIFRRRTAAAATQNVCVMTESGASAPEWYIVQ